MEKTFKKIWLISTFIITMMSCCALMSCNGDEDEPSPGKPGITSNYDVENFTVDFISDDTNNYNSIHPSFIPNGENYEQKFCIVDMYTIDYPNFTKVIGFAFDYYSHAHNVRMAKYGDVSNISQIKSVRGLSWIDKGVHEYGNKVNADCLLLSENTGYILEGSYGGEIYYIRIFIKKFNRNSDNKIIGITGAWQQFKPE